MKREPYVKDFVESLWPWTTESIVFVVGSNILVGPRTVIHFDGTPILEAKSIPVVEDGPPSVSLSMSLTAPDGEPVMTMQDNWLSFSVGALQSVNCPPQARRFEIAHKSGVEFKVGLKRHNLEGFLEQWCPRQSEIQSRLIQNINEAALDSDGLIPTLTVNCNLIYGPINVLAIDSGLSVAGFDFQGCVVSPGGHFVVPKLGGGELFRFG